MTRLPLLFGLMLLAACQPAAQQGDPHGIRLDVSQLEVHEQSIDLQASMDIQLSEAALDALEQGIALHFRLSIGQRQGPRWWHSVQPVQSLSWSVRHLPLTGHYVLTDEQSGLSLNFPRLRHLLAHISAIDRQLRLPPDLEWDGQQAGELELRAVLDYRRLPAPMRLPALVNPEWQLESNRVTWPPDPRA